MDAVTYGRLVHAGGYATGGVIRRRPLEVSNSWPDYPLGDWSRRVKAFPAGSLFVELAVPAGGDWLDDARRIDEGAITINQWRERNGYPPVEPGRWLEHASDA